MAIESVQSQTYMHWELLVIDDGSSDNTAQIVTELAQKDHRIIYIKNEQNLGIQKTLNKGLKESKGEYIARIDDDDQWIDKDKLKKQIEFLEKNNDYVLVGTGVRAVYEDGSTVFEHINPLNNLDIRKIILNKNCFIHSSVMFRKSTALKLDGYSEDLNMKHVEDYDLWLRMGTIGKFANLRTVGIKLLIHKESLSAKNKIIQFEKSIKLAKLYKSNYPNFYLAYCNLHMRMLIYRIFTGSIIRRLYPFLYKVYKKF